MNMVEVFKTNVNDMQRARDLVNMIHGRFQGYRANFDLEDCDRILRVQSAAGDVESAGLMAMMLEQGIEIAVLPDEIPLSRPVFHWSLADNVKD